MAMISSGRSPEIRSASVSSIVDARRLVCRLFDFLHSRPEFSASTRQRRRRSEPDLSSRDWSGPTTVNTLRHQRRSLQGVSGTLPSKQAGGAPSQFWIDSLFQLRFRMPIDCSYPTQELSNLAGHGNYSYVTVTLRVVQQKHRKRIIWRSPPLSIPQFFKLIRRCLGGAESAHVRRPLATQSYSARITATGSTRTARKAGSRLPARVMTTQRPAAIPKVPASSGFTPARRACIVRAAA